LIYVNFTCPVVLTLCFRVLTVGLFMVTSRCYEADFKRVETDLVDVSPELALA
jgi:hypothetical protein